jgi:hypothetical protein
MQRNALGNLGRNSPFWKIREVVAKRPLEKSKLDSPELHAEKKVKIEEVSDNSQAVNADRPARIVKSVEGVKSVENVKSAGSVKSVENIKKDVSIKKRVEVRSSNSNPKEESEEILDLDSEGDIVSRKREAAVPAALSPGHKDYFSTRIGDNSDIKGYSWNAEPSLKTLLEKDGLNCSDADLVKQSLVAWRHRSHGEYKPDRFLPSTVQLTHAKILMSALTKFKEQRIRNQFSHRAKLYYKHDQYSVMYKTYHVSADTCSPYELMSKVDSDRDILYRFRCAPRSEFYSMFMEDTPGYVPSKHWCKPSIQESSRAMSKRDDRSKSSSRSIQSPEYVPKSLVMNLERSSSVMNHESSSSRESFSVMKHVSSSTSESSAVMKEPSSNSKNSSSVKEYVVWGSTDHLSARRYKNTQHGLRFNPIVGEGIFQ